MRMNFQGKNGLSLKGFMTQLNNWAMTGFFKRDLSDNARKVARSFLQAGLVVIFLYAISLFNINLFRVLVEFFSAVVSFGIFIIAWNSRKITRNNFLIFIGLVGAIRTFIYPGLTLLAGNSINLSQQLRIVGLCLEAGSFFIALSYIGNRKKTVTRVVFLIYLIILVSIFLAIFSWDIFPVAYESVAGATKFKRFGDLFAIFVFIISAFVIIKKKNCADPLVKHFLLLMLVFQILAISIHKPFMDVYSFNNFISQAFRFTAFFFLYKAVIETGLMNPYRVLFRSLKDREMSLEKHRDHLEKMVLERIMELEKANAKLKREINERKIIESNLLESYSHLGTINRKVSLLLELNKNSYRKKRREILDYILNCAVNLSCASVGALYFRSDNGFYLALSKGVGQKCFQDIKFVNSQSCGFLKSILVEKILIRGLSRNVDLGKLDLGEKSEYFIILPFLISWKVRGFMFLGFHDKKSMEQQEVEFLDVFSNNATLAMFNAEILK